MDFVFGIDSVLLSNYAKDIKKRNSRFRFGNWHRNTWNTIMWENRLKQNIWYRSTTRSCRDGTKRSVKLNNLENRFEIINKNIKDLESVFDKNSFDFIITNPPYKKNGYRQNK